MDYFNWEYTKVIIVNLNLPMISFIWKIIGLNFERNFHLHLSINNSNHFLYQKMIWNNFSVTFVWFLCILVELCLQNGLYKGFLKESLIKGIFQANPHQKWVECEKLGLLIQNLLCKPSKAWSNKAESARDCESKRFWLQKAFLSSSYGCWYGS